MSRKFVEKNIKLSLDFDRYLNRNPDVLVKIPKGACLFITVKGDDAFNRNSLAIAEKVKEKKQKCIEARKEGSKWVLEPLPA